MPATDGPRKWGSGPQCLPRYRLTAEEVPGIASGAASIALGGTGGRECSVRDGDIAMLPTGAGHYLVEASTDFLVVEATNYLDRSTNQSMTYGSPNSDLQHFLRSWLSDPLRVSAVAPSGEALARLMTREISPCDGPILELGPGTGVFTKALLDRGVSESELTLIENGPDFARLLRHRFPQSRVLLADAARLGRLDLFPDASVGAVVSGLPLLSMSPRQVLSVLRGTFGYLRPDGTFYQFTYGLRCPVPRPILDRLRLKATRLGQTVRNLPPATVYRITRRPSN